MNKSLSIVIVLFAISILALGCGGDDPAAAGTPAPPPPTASETSGEVAFEPAYPEEISTEELSAGDTAQQQVHKHVDGDVHAHDEESTTTRDHGHEH